MSEKRRSVKDRLREFFSENVGKVVTSRDLQKVAAPASEWARRVRELRDEEGWEISTHHDSADLRPGEYRLEQPHSGVVEVAFRRTLSQRVRAVVLDRDGHTCQMCGLSAGDLDPETGRKTRLHIGHVVDKSRGGSDDPSNLRTLCSTCNQGAKNLTLEKPTAQWLLQQVRRANHASQVEVYEWLNNKLDPQDKHGENSATS